MHGNKHREADKIRRQRNTYRIKEQNRILEKELKRIETSNVPDTEFKTLVIRVLNNLSENFNKKTGNKSRDRKQRRTSQK